MREIALVEFEQPTSLVWDRLPDESTDSLGRNRVNFSWLLLLHITALPATSTNDEIVTDCVFKGTKHSVYQSH